LPDRNADPKVRKLEDSFIAYDLGKNYEGYETYLVVMKLKEVLFQPHIMKTEN
jgi:hypothetical protein